MKRSVAFGILTLALSLPFGGNGLRAEDLATSDGRVFRNIEIRDLDYESITVSHTGGVTKIPLKDLPSDTQKRFSPLELFKELRRKIPWEGGRRKLLAIAGADESLKSLAQNALEALVSRHV